MCSCACLLFGYVLSIFLHLCRHLYLWELHRLQLSARQTNARVRPQRVNMRGWSDVCSYLLNRSDRAELWEQHNYYPTLLPKREHIISSLGYQLHSLTGFNRMVREWPFPLHLWSSYPDVLTQASAGNLSYGRADHPVAFLFQVSADESTPSTRARCIIRPLCVFGGAVQLHWEVMFKVYPETRDIKSDAENPHHL